MGRWRRGRWSRWAWLLGLGSVVGCGARIADAPADAGPTEAGPEAGASSTTVQVLAFGDFEEQLDPVVDGAKAYGGLASLSAYFQRDRSSNAATVIVSTGNTFGMGPPLAAQQSEKPVTLAAGGYGYAMLPLRGPAAAGGLMTDDLQKYVQDHSPVAAPAGNRILVTP